MNQRWELSSRSTSNGGMHSYVPALSIHSCDGSRTAARQFTRLSDLRKRERERGMIKVGNKSLQVKGFKTGHDEEMRQGTKRNNDSKI